MKIKNLSKGTLSITENSLQLRQAYDVLQNQFSRLLNEHTLLQEQYEILLSSFTEKCAAFDVINQVLNNGQGHSSGFHLVARGSSNNLLQPAPQMSEIVREDLIRITISRQINGSWVDNNPKDQKGDTITGEISQHLYFEHNDKIKLNITNLNPSNVNFVIYKKGHGENNYTKIFPNGNSQVLSGTSKYMANDSPIPNMDVSLPNCQLPSTLAINEVPAIDTYLVMVWAGLGSNKQESIIKLYRKVYIYNEHQAQLEFLKDSELEQETDVNESLEDFVATNSKDLKLLDMNADQIEQDKINQIKALGFSNETLIRKKLQETEGNLEKTILQLVDLV